ncbi:hemerythrin domain-containing protein [Erythrobacter sp. THAF29]|uniref:hemerythrin domain-containing protein n=1 Tax=Erythrobacter sp. THAF29 TaxID=2587851 RepID=UPI001268F9E6|nr:hemerythrin domain-containing protein [Erythrobacter sp. THAF29]QFT77662.1 Hemerythrin HHE cation binding domain protein [Erythrobacter sp. THAF29]
MNQQATVLNRLKSDHDRQRELLDRIAETSGDTEKRRELFTELTKELKSHAAAEEQAVYSEMLADPEVSDETRHSVAEHHEIDEMLNDLAATDMSSPAWLQKFKQLDERYRHHINEEEEDHFPDFAEQIDDAMDKEMTDTFDERKKAEKEAAEITPEKMEDAKE